MEHVKPWFIVGKCGDCDDLHRCGPFPNKEEAEGFITQMAEQDDFLQDPNAEQRDTPLSDDELSEIIAGECRNQVKMISIQTKFKMMFDKTEPNENMTDMVIEAIQSVTISMFNDYRPGTTGEEMVELFRGDTIGEVEGHA